MSAQSTARRCSEPTCSHRCPASTSWEPVRRGRWVRSCASSPAPGSPGRLLRRGLPAASAPPLQSPSAVVSGGRQKAAPSVLVTDGEQRCALAACRALAAAGYEVGVASTGGPAAAKWSRWCSDGISVPDARRDPTGFAERLRGELERRRYDVVLPGGDASLLALSAHRARLEP